MMNNRLKKIRTCVICCFLCGLHFDLLNALTSSEIKEEFKKEFAAVSSPEQLSAIVENSKYNQKYLQNYPSAAKSIFTMAQSFTKAAAGPTLPSIKVLLSNLRGKKFLTSKQSSVVNNLLSQVNLALAEYLKPTFSKELLAVTNLLELNSVATNPNYDQTVFRDYPSSTNSIYTRLQTYVDSMSNPSGWTLMDLKNLLINVKDKKFITSAQRATIIGWISKVDAAISAVASTSIKVAFAAALEYAINPALVNEIVLNVNYNQTYLQDYPSSTNSIYTKVKSFVDNVSNPVGWTLTDLKMLIKNMQNKKFLTASQNSSLAGWMTIVDTAISKGGASSAVASVQAAFLSELSFATTPSALNAVVVKSDYNQAYLQNYPSQTDSIYTKAKSFVDNLSNPVDWTLTDLISLLTNMQNKNFLTAEQNSMITTWMTTVNNAILAAGQTSVISSVKNALASELSSATTPGALNLIVTKSDYNQTYLQDYPSSTNSIYTKAKSFVDSVSNPSGWALTDLIVLLTNMRNKNFLTAEQNSMITAWMTTVNNAILAAGQSSVILSVKNSLSAELSSATTPGALNLIVTKSDYNQTYLQDYPNSTNSIYAKAKSFVDNVSNPIGWKLIDLRMLLTNMQNKNFLTDAQKATVLTWITTVDSAISAAGQSSVILSVKNSLSAELSSATTPGALNLIVNKSDYNQTYLQDYPSTTNSIYTKAKSLVDNVSNPIGWNLTDLKILLMNMQNKNFLTDAQKTTVVSWITTVDSLISAAGQASVVVSVKDVLSSELSAATTPSALNLIVTKSDNNQTYLQDYPSPTNSIYAKAKSFVDNISNPVGWSLTDLKMLLTNMQNKNFLTAEQNSMVASWITVVNNAISVASQAAAVAGIKYAFSSDLAMATTPTDVNSIVSNADYNQTYLQDYPSATNSIYTKAKSFVDVASNPSGWTLTELKTLLTNMQNKNFVSTEQNSTITTWISTVDGLLSQASVSGSSSGTVASGTSSGSVASGTSSGTPSGSSTVSSASTITSVKSAFASALASANTPSSVNTVATKSTYNQTYLQDYPSVTNSIYTKIQDFMNSLYGYDLTMLNDLKLLLTNVQGKLFLTSSQNASISLFLSQVDSSIGVFSVKSALSSKLESVSTPVGLNAVVTDSVYNKTYLQDYPGVTNSIYTKAKSFVDNMSNPVGWTLADLNSLLINMQSKNFLTATQNSNVAEWIALVSNAMLAATQFSEITSVKNAFASELTSATTPSALNSIATNAIYNQTYLQNYPSATNSIYTKVKSFVDNASSPTNWSLNDLNALLINMQDKKFLTSDQNATIAEWLTTVNNAMLASAQDATIANVKNSFSTDFAAATTLNALSAIVTNASYNKAYLQDYPSATDSIYTRIQNFMDALYGYDLATLNDLKKLLTTVQGKLFLTTAQNTSVAVFISQVDYAIDILNTRVSLSAKLAVATTPNSLNAIVTNSAYNQTYLQNYPSEANSIYTKIKFFVDNVSNPSGWNLSDLNTLLSSAQNKNFLTSVQNSNVVGWVTIVNNAILTASQFVTTTRIKSAFASDLSAATTPIILNVIVNNLTYNKTYLQDYPSATNSIYTKIQKFMDDLSSYDLTMLNEFKKMLTNAQGKLFLTPSQNTSVSLFISQVDFLIDDLSVKGTLSKLLADAGTPVQLSAIAANSIYNKASLQNYPSESNSIYTKIKSFIGDFFISSKWPAADLIKLLKNAQNKNYLTAFQNYDLSSWIEQVNNKILEDENKKAFASMLSSVNTPAALNEIVKNANYNQTYFQNYPDVTNSIFTKVQGFVNNMLNPQGWTLADLQGLLKNAQGKSFLTTDQNTSVAEWLKQISNMNDFVTAMSAATTLIALNEIVNNPNYNQSYFQNYPNVTNSIFTKLQGFANSIFNPQGWTLTDLQELLTKAQGKSFLTTDQNTSVSGWLAQIGNMNEFVKILSVVATPAALNEIVNNPNYNQAYLQNYPNAANSIFTKLQGFANSIFNPQGWTLTDLQELLTKAQGKSFLTADQNTSVAGWLAQISNMIEFVNALSAVATPVALNEIVNNANYNQAYLQNYPSATNSIFTKLQGFANSIFNPQGWTLADLQGVLTNIQGKKFLSSDQNTSVVGWLSQISNMTEFSKILSAVSTPGELSKIVTNSNYNQTYFQNYPSSANSIFSLIQNFVNNMFNPQGWTLDDLIELLKNSKDKGFLTADQNYYVAAALIQINNMIAFKSALSSTNTIQGLSLVINDNNYNQTYLQNYPTEATSVFAMIKKFADDATNPKGWVLADLQQLLAGAINKKFLTTDQNAYVNGALTQVNTMIEFASEFKLAKTFDDYVNIINKTSYNQTYLQNYPNVSNSLYSVAQSYSYMITGRVKTTVLTSYQKVLSGMVDKKFLTETQNAKIKDLLSQLDSKLGSRVSIKSFDSVIAKVVTPVDLNVIVSDSAYNQESFQNYPDLKTSIYALIQGFVNNIRSPQGWTLTDLQTLLTNSQNKNFLTVDQNTFVINALTQVNNMTAFVGDLSKVASPADIGVMIKNTNYNQAYLQGYPDAQNSIYAKIQNFVGNVDSMQGQSLSDLKDVLLNSKSSDLFTQQEKTNLVTWVSVVDDAFSAFERKVEFVNLLRNANTPNALYDIVSNSKYNKTYLQDYPSVNDSMYTKLQGFVAGASSPQGWTLIDLQKLLNSCGGSNLFTASQNINISSWQTQINNYLAATDIAVKIKADFATALSTANTIADLNAIVSNATFNQAYLQGTDLYNKIQTFADKFENPQGWILSDLQMLLRNSYGKNLFTSQQNIKISEWLTKVDNTIVAANAIAANKANFSSALASAATPNDLSTIMSNANYNQTYLQNYPSSTNSIFTAVQKFVNNMAAPVGWLVSDLQKLLSGGQNSNLFDASQKTIINTWLTQVNNLIAAENNKAAFVDVVKAAKTPNDVFAIITNPTFNQSYLLIPGQTNKLYSKIQEFVGSINYPQGWILTDLQKLLSSVSSCVLFSSQEKETMSTWLTTVNNAVAIAKTKSDFVAALDAVKKPSDVNAIINNQNFNKTYLQDYPDKMSSIYYKIRGFVDDISNPEGWTLSDLRTLLISAKYSNLISESQQSNIENWLYNVEQSISEQSSNVGENSWY